MGTGVRSSLEAAKVEQAGDRRFACGKQSPHPKKDLGEHRVAALNLEKHRVGAPIWGSIGWGLCPPPQKRET